MLSCNATSIVPFTFHWEKLNNGNWGPLPNDTTLAVKNTTNTTTLSSIYIQQSDEGSYRCVATNTAGTNISNVANITVYGEL